MSKSFIFPVENNGDYKLTPFPRIQEQINRGRQVVNKTQPDFLFNLTYFHNPSDFRDVREDSHSTLLNEEYNEIYNQLKHASNTVEVLAENVTSLNLEQGDQLFNFYDSSVQSDKLTSGFVQKDCSKVDLNIPADVARNYLKKNKTDKELVPKEINQNQTKMESVNSSVDVLVEDEDDFWSMIETGIETAMNHSESVEFVKNWIKQNSTWENNQQVVEAECDQSPTIKEDLPEQLVTKEKVETRRAAVDVNGSILEANDLHLLTDEITVDYTIIRKADFEHKVYFYTVDDINGTVNGLAPNDYGYVEAALNNIIFPKLSSSEHNRETGSLEFDATSLIVPLVMEGVSLAEAQNGKAKVYFSYAGAIGGDGLDHIKLLDGNIFGFKKLLDDTDNDFNNIIIKLDCFSI